MKELIDYLFKCTSAAQYITLHYITLHYSAVQYSTVAQ